MTEDVSSKVAQILKSVQLDNSDGIQATVDDIKAIKSDLKRSCQNESSIWVIHYSKELERYEAKLKIQKDLLRVVRYELISYFTEEQKKLKEADN